MDTYTQNKNAPSNHLKTDPRARDTAAATRLRMIPPFRRFLPAFVLLLAAILWPVAAQAAFVFEINQAGPDVVVNGSGSFNLTGLMDDGPTLGLSAILPGAAIVGVSNANDSLEVYEMTTGPASWGTGDLTLADSNSGDDVALNGSSGAIFLPPSYVSGSTLSDTMTFNNTTLSNLGIDPGTYIYTWGSGVTADSLTVTVVPEPSTWALLALGGIGLVGLTLRSRALRI